MEGITEEQMKNIIIVLGVSVIKSGEVSAGRRSLLWTIIVTVLNDKDVAYHTSVLLEMLGAQRTKHVDDVLMHEAVKQLPDHEQHFEYKHLKDKLEQAEMERKMLKFVERKGGEKSARDWETPACVKELRPLGAKCSLVMDSKLGAFEAYYAGGKPTNSMSKTWEGPRNNYSKLQCLNICVDYLWTNHADKNRESWPTI